MKRTVR